MHYWLLPDLRVRLVYRYVRYVPYMTLDHYGLCPTYLIGRLHTDRFKYAGLYQHAHTCPFVVPGYA